MNVRVFIAILTCPLSQLFGALPAPYDSLNELLPFDGGGYYINSVPMKKILEENDVKIVIELGSWTGQSTRHIASVLPEDGIVYAVDHWLGSPEHQGQMILPVLYRQFLSNVIHTNLTHKIIPMRMTTLEAAAEFSRKGIVPDLVYVDACHEESSVYQDLVAYFPLVQGHGILCGDDWGWGKNYGYPVYKAVYRFAVENNLDIQVHDGWFWWFVERK